MIYNNEHANGVRMSMSNPDDFNKTPIINPKLVSRKVAVIASLPGVQHKKGIVWRTSRQVCLFVPRQGTELDASIFMKHAGGVPVLNWVTIVELLSQHVVKGNYWVPTCGSPPYWWWGYQSLMTCSKWATTFHQA